MGVLEKHWNGSLLDTMDTVLKFAQTMTWKGVHPVVELVKKTYQKGVKLARKEMDALEKRFERLPGLEKWFVKIASVPLALSGRLFFWNRLDERLKYLRKMKKRYDKAEQAERAHLLDEMEHVTELHRKSLIRLMSGDLERHPRTEQRGVP